MIRRVVLTDEELSVLDLTASDGGAKLSRVVAVLTGDSLVCRAKRALSLLERLDSVGAASWDFNLNTYRVTPWGKTLLTIAAERAS